MGRLLQEGNSNTWSLQIQLKCSEQKQFKPNEKEQNKRGEKSSCVFGNFLVKRRHAVPLNLKFKILECGTPVPHAVQCALVATNSKDKPPNRWKMQRLWQEQKKAEQKAIAWNRRKIFSGFLSSSYLQVLCLSQDTNVKRIHGGFESLTSFFKEYLLFCLAFQKLTSHSIVQCDCRHVFSFNK